MTLSWKKELEERGPKTSFFLNTPGLKLFPLIFEQITYGTMENGQIMYRNCSLTIRIRLCLNMNTIFDIRFSIRPPGYSNPDSCGVNINIVPLFEYGYEEEYLPEIRNINIIWHENQLLDLIKGQISPYQTHYSHIFPQILQDFLTQYHFVKEYAKSHYGKDYSDHDASDLLTADEISLFIKFFQSLDFLNEVEQQLTDDNSK